MIQLPLRAVNGEAGKPARGCEVGSCIKSIAKALSAVARRMASTNKAWDSRARTSAKRTIGRWRLTAVLGLAAVLAGDPVGLQASDHADPVALKHPETNITGLFFFPQGDQMILIFNVRRSLRNPKPYTLEPY